MDEVRDESSKQLQKVADFIDHQTSSLITALPRDDEDQPISSTYDALTNSGRCRDTTRNDATEDRQRTIRNGSENASSNISNITANDSGIATNSSKHHKASAILNLTECSASFSSLQNNDIVDDDDDDYQDDVTYEEEKSVQQRLKSNVGGEKSEKFEQRPQKQNVTTTKIVRDDNDTDNNESMTETTTSLSETDVTAMSKIERGRQSTLRPGAVRVRPNRNDGVAASSTSSAFNSTDFTVLSDASNENDGENQRMPRKSSIFMTELEATLVDDENNNHSEEYRHHQQQQSTLASTIVTDAIPMDVTLLEQLHSMEQKNGNNLFVSRYHWVILRAVLLVIVTVVVTTTSVLRVTRRNNKNNNMTTMYQGNWYVRNFSQITQHFVMLAVHMDNCSESIPSLHYTIQCGPNQTMEQSLNDDNERPNAAIEFEYSAQKGSCIRTQVNVLTCHATFNVTKVRIGTVISCGTTNETAVNNVTSVDNDDPSFMPLVTIRTYPATGVSCQVDKSYQRESYNMTKNKTTYMTSAESKSLENVGWISTGRLCNGHNLTNFILDPSSCHTNSTMVTIYDPSKSAPDWSFCLSTNAIEVEENIENVTILPAMTVIDRYNESIFQTTCPYMKEYVVADPDNYVLAASAVASMVSN